MVNVLCLDLATVTGWAVADSATYPRLIPLQANIDKPPKPQSGVVTFRGGADKESLGQFFWAFNEWLIAMCENFGVDCLVFEQPFVGPRTNQTTARKLFGMAGAVETIAHARDATCFQANISRVRKHFIGFTAGRASVKAATIQACQNRGWQVADDNEADALATLDWFMNCLAPVALPARHKAGV